MHPPSPETSTPTPSMASTDIAFGDFRLAVPERRLRHHGSPVQIGSRALDILIVLAQHAGEVVEKRTLLARVWPGIVVEESSLRAHIAGLRKVLGDGVGEARYITNIPGRGYCLVAPIMPADAVADADLAVPPPASAGGPQEATARAPLPPALARMIGRDTTVTMLAERLRKHRLLSLVGPGGVGKTTTAISLAHQVTRNFNLGAIFVDLGFVNDGNPVLATIASGLGVRLDRADVSSLIIAHLKETPQLLVLDSCEHVIDVVAGICERIVVEAPASSIIVTSREALRVEGESVFRLAPLALPPADGDISTAETVSYAAVEMFLERAKAAGLEDVTDAEIPLIAHLCRQLDGLPLAIELAAARASSFGISGLTKLLDQQFGMYWQGRRTAHPRHQTMHSVLDWSYRLLTEYERQVLQFLSVFKGLFSFADAVSVLANTDTEEGDLIDALDGLVAKSMLSPHFEQNEMHYRLLDSTRAYAAYRLAQSERLAVTRKRHALWICGQLERMIMPDLIAFHARLDHTFAAQLSDIRAALTWAFSDGGETEVATWLAAMAGHAFLAMSLFDECSRWTRQGLHHLAGDITHSQREMTLLASLSAAMMFTSAGSDQTKQLIQRALILADEADDVQHQLWLLAGLHLLEVRLGDVEAVFAVAERAQAIAGTLDDAAAKQMSSWMLGMSHHLAGRQDQALLYCAPEEGRNNNANAFLLFGFNHRIRALIVRTRALWLAGHTDQAIALAHGAVREGLHSGSPATHCLALIYSTTLFFWLGDLATASVMIDTVLERSQRHGLHHYAKVAACLQGELWIRQGRVDAGVVRLEQQLVLLRSEQHEVLVWGFNLALAEGYALAGRVAEANRLVDAILVGAGHQRFDLPEVLRVKAQMSMLADAQARDHARTLLWQAVDIATEQHAQSWLLRCATSLAELAPTQPPDERVTALLTAAVQGMPRSQPTADWQRAAAALSGLHHQAAASKA